MLQPLTLENLNKIDPKLLQDQATFAAIEDLIYEAEAMGEPDAVRKLFIDLSELIESADDKNETLAKKYLPLLVTLRLIGLISVSDKEKERFISEEAVTLMRQPYADIDHWLKSLFGVYRDDDEIRQTFQRVLVRGLESSLNILGIKDITVKGIVVKPFVKNWLADYNNFPFNKVKRGALEEASYLSQAQNVRTLNSDEQKVLRKILHLYDWLRFVISEKRPEEQERVTTPLPARFPIPPVPIPNSGLSIDKLKSELRQAPPARSEVEKKYVAATHPTLTPTEIKREVATPELLPHLKPPVPLPPKPFVPPVRPIPVPHVETKIDNLDDIKFVDDLKKINPSHLRRGNLAMDLQKIKSKIAYLSAVNRLFPHEVVAIFEQSPLFKAYLAQGSAKVVGQPAKGELSQQEFEAIADLKKSIESM